MKRVIFIFLLFLTPLFANAQEKPGLIYFYSPSCKACLKLKAEFLPPIKDKYQDRLQWRDVDITENDENFGLLLSAAAKFKRDEAATPAIFVGEMFLVGTTEIGVNLEEAIDLALKGKVKTFLSSNQIDILKTFENLSIFTIASAGLIDGINPCAFAVIVFFVSFLAVYGYGKKQIVCVGASYCVAVFITYLLIGLGLFKFLYVLSGFYKIIKIFYYFVAASCFVLCALALYDYFKVRKTGGSKDSLLQLPKFLKKRINTVVGQGLRHKQGEGLLSLSITSFAVGFFVSLLEAVCTGQVYIPTIVFILKNTDLKLKAFSFLVLYNVMFILPLLIIFVLTLMGVKSKKFNIFLQNNIGRIKIIMAILFLFLGILIVVIS